MKSVARPVMAAFLVSGAIASLVVSPAGGQKLQGDPQAISPVTYLGPGVFYNPNDPLEPARWTLGLTLPRRVLLPLQGRHSIRRSADFDFGRGKVLLSYRAGEQDIHPPLAFTPRAYAALAFDRQLRETWIAGAVVLLSASSSGPGRGLGVSLPFELPFTQKLFGSGEPNLTVSGREQITISGTSTWLSNPITGERGGGSLFPKLDMRQRLNVNLKGTIGSKLFVDVAQNSEALTPLENSIKIRYRGDEDDVVRAVELGNTNLSLPPTQFISFSSRQEGLFGVKAQAQIGSINLTAIASRQQGESGQDTYEGGSKPREIFVNDFDFIQGKYFFVADPDSALVPEAIVELRLYLDDNIPQNDTEKGAVDTKVWLDPNDSLSTFITGKFHQLVEGEDADFVLLNEQNLSLPQLVLNTPISRTHTLAVYYRTETITVGFFVDADGDTVTVDSFVAAPGDTANLKMLRPAEEDWGENDLTTSVWAPVRRLEMKNAYSLKVSNIDLGTFELRIVKDIAGAGGENPSTLDNDPDQTPLIEVLGLDQKNNASGEPIPDGKVDEEFIDKDRGVLFFPDLRPFAPSLVDIEGHSQSDSLSFRVRSWPRDPSACRPYALGYSADPDFCTVILAPAATLDEETVPELYDLLPRELARTRSDHHIYLIEASVKSEVSNIISLNTFGNVLEGSETVRLNGEILERGPDYSIFYATGTITLKHPDATDPDADLVITYSYDSPFTRGSQSLVGATLSTNQTPSSKFSFSTSWLHESQGTPDRRPRLGQEPTKTTVGDVSGRLRLEPWGLTDLVDRLPLVQTNAPSRLELSGAVGVSFPDPNTRDVVFIDDMEGAEVSTSPGIGRGNWFFSSAPSRAVDYLTGQTRVFFQPDPIDRGQLLWFSPNTVEVKDLTPREDAANERDNLVPVLEVIYIPQDNPGTFGSWGGLVTLLAQGGTDLSQAQFIEIWINDYVNDVNAVERRGEVLIDIGSVSEDAVWDPLSPPAPPNGVLDVENTNQDDTIDLTEDVGLDGKIDAEEARPDPPPKRLSPFSPADDPAGDRRVRDIETHLPEQTIWQRISKYRGINGTEDNDRGDGEDLDRDFEFDTKNDYLEYRVDLAAPGLIDVGRDFGITDPDNGWRLYRIPLDEAHLEEGVPNLSQVKHLRIWFRGIDPGDTLDVQIASIEIVGNRWEIEDSLSLAQNELFNVSVVNNKETTDYAEPFGVERLNNIKEREQSISLDFENFRDGNEFRAFRRLQDARDYTLYQNLAFFLNPRFESIPGDSVEFYLRFGSGASTDTLSYYEVATVLRGSDLNLWQDFRFLLTDLSQLKIGTSGVAPDSFLVGPGDGQGPGLPRVVLDNGLKVTIRGNPSFSRVRRISVGLRNISGRDLSQGSVWFNELRMGQVRRDLGWASRASINLQLADLANISGSADLTTADFLRLGQTRGSGTRNFRYDLRGKLAVHKFVEGLGIDAPLSVRLSRGRLTPKFRPNSDILFDGSESGRDITETKERRASISLTRLNRGISSPWLRYTLDGVRLSGAVSENFRDGVTRADTTYQHSGSASYNLSTNSIKPVRLFNRFELWVWPRNLSMTVTGSRLKRRVWTPEAGNQLRLTNDTVTRTGTLTLGATAQPIRGLTYTWGSNRDLIDDHFGPDTSVVRQQRPVDKVLGINIGREVQQSHNLNFNYTPSYLGLSLKPRIAWTSGSSQNFNPSLTLAGYDSTVFQMTNNNSASLSLSFPLGKWISSVLGPGEGGKAQRPPVRRGGGRRGEVDSLQAGAEGEDDLSSADQLRKLFTQVIRFKNIQTSGTLSRRSSFSNIHGTPPLGYRLGLSRDIGLGTDVVSIPSAPFNQSRGRSVTFRGNTSVTLFNQLGLDFNYQKRKDDSRTNNLLGRIEDNTTWPDVRFNWGDIHKKLPILKKVFSEFRAVSTSYSRVTRTTGNDENPRENVSTTINWRPLISVQGTLYAGWRTSLSANRSSTVSKDRRQGSAATTHEQSSTTYTLNLSKKFKRGPGGRGRNVDFKLDISHTSTGSESRSSFQIRPQQRKQKQLRITTSAGIKLTKSMGGTFGLDFNQTSDPIRDQTRRSLGVRFTTGFSF